MAGDITQPKRPRYQSNERFDTVDANAASIAPRDHDDAITRALLSTPRNVVATPTGLIVTGFSLTPNPTAANDGLVRINAETGVALDANGRTIIKPTGTTLDISIPVGTHQLYVYYVEVPTDVAKRRFLPAAPPFVEFTQAIDTAFQGEVGLFIRAGGLASAVAADVVNGATTPLCLIGIATNTGAGGITIAGNVNGPGVPANPPNGTDITNRLSTVVAPTIPPTANTRSGSPQTIHDVLTAALHTVGQTAWRGSDFLTPSAANNFGAYNTPAGGADKAFRQALGYVTIGNGTTIIGDFNTSDYVNANTLLTAALASLPATGGTLLLKRGVALAGFAGATVALPAGKTVTLMGEHAGTPTTAQLTFVVGENLTTSATGVLILRNLNISYTEMAITLSTGPFQAFDVAFQKPAGATSTPAISAAGNASDMHLERVTFDVNVTVGVTTGMCMKIVGQARRIKMLDIHYTMSNLSASGFEFTDMRDNIHVERVIADDTVAAVALIGAGTFILNSLSNTTVGDFEGRVFRDIVCANDRTAVFQLGSAGSLLIDGLMHVSPLAVAIISGAYTGTGRLEIRNSIVQYIYLQGAFPDVRLSNVEARQGCVIGLPGQDHGDILVTGGCRFLASLYGLEVYGRKANMIRVEDSFFSGQGHVSADVQAILITCGNGIGSTNRVKRIEILRNTFDNFYNVAWIGANTSQRLIGINTDGVGRVTISGNIASNLMRGSSGLARGGAYLVAFNSRDESSHTCQIYRLDITDNVVGTEDENFGIADYCGLAWFQRILHLDRVVISRNTILTSYDSTGGAIPKINYIIQMQNGATASVIIRHGLFIRNNDIFIQGGEPTMAEFGIVRWNWNLAGGNVDVIAFSDNNVQFSGGFCFFDNLTGFGCNFDRTGGGTLLYASIADNIVTYDSFFIVPFFFTIRIATPAILSVPTPFPAVLGTFANCTECSRV